MSDTHSCQQTKAILEQSGIINGLEDRFKSVEESVTGLHEASLRLQNDMLNAFGEIKESVKLFHTNQEKMTMVLVDIAKTHERQVAQGDRIDKNEKSIDTLFKITRDVKSGGAVRHSDGKIDKGLVTLWVSAIAGFFGFLFQLIVSLIDTLTK